MDGEVVSKAQWAKVRTRTNVAIVLFVAQSSRSFVSSWATEIRIACGIRRTIQLDLRRIWILESRSLWGGGGTVEVLAAGGDLAVVVDFL